MEREVVVGITKGKLDFGPWEQILYGEFDGRRRMRVLVKIIGEQVPFIATRLAHFCRSEILTERSLPYTPTPHIEVMP
jgi:hypothetical protein